MFLKSVLKVSKKLSKIFFSNEKKTKKIKKKSKKKNQKKIKKKFFLNSPPRKKNLKKSPQKSKKKIFNSPPKKFQKNLSKKVYLLTYGNVKKPVWERETRIIILCVLTYIGPIDDNVLVSTRGYTGKRLPWRHEKCYTIVQ